MLCVSPVLDLLVKTAAKGRNPELVADNLERYRSAISVSVQCTIAHVVLSRVYMFWGQNEEEETVNTMTSKEEAEDEAGSSIPSNKQDLASNAILVVHPRCSKQ